MYNNLYNKNQCFQNHFPNINQNYFQNNYQNQQQNQNINNIIQIQNQNQLNNVIQAQNNQNSINYQNYYPILKQNIPQYYIWNNSNQLINANNIFNNLIPFNNNINNNLILNPLIKNQNNNQNNLTNQFVNKNNINNNNHYINKIKDECDTGHAKPISESVIEKLYNSIVRIKLDNKFATGFFMKFKIKKKEVKCLFTCNHVISQNDINKKKNIKIYYGKKGKEERREIKLDKNIRFIKTFNED